MKLKIYLADLTHTGLGTATDAFPLNIGVVASYCLKNFKDDVDVKLFKFPEELQKAIDEEKPDILSCSNSMTNLALDLIKLFQNNKLKPKSLRLLGNLDN